MSASERLGSLSIPQEFWIDSGEDASGIAPLVAALPEIVAVIEAAESVESVFDDDRLTHFLVMAERGGRLRAALAALEEKLTP